MKIYEFIDYKAYILKKISQLPSRGRGEITRIAKALNIHTTMVTHILKEKYQLTMEQSLKLAKYFGFNELETEYLITLVQWARAGDKPTKDFFLTKINELKNKALNLTNRLAIKNQLNESDRAYYYSNYTYSFVRLLTAIDRFQTAENIAEEIQLPIVKVRQILDFLLSRGLCTEENNKIKYKSLPTYLEASSPLVSLHHKNWRQKAQENFEQIRDQDLIFTFPTVISDSDAERIREKLIQVIEDIKKISDPSASNELYTLNIDWMKLTL